MLSADRKRLLDELLSGANKEELAWINGYLSGILLGGEVPQAAPVLKPVANKITITYGTETGNSKKLASDFASKAKKMGINAKLVSLDQYRLNDLPKEEYFLTIISTHGEGEPPAAAKKFYDHVHTNGFKVDKMKFGVFLSSNRDRSN